MLRGGSCFAALHIMLSIHTLKLNEVTEPPDLALVWTRKWAIREGKGLTKVTLPAGSEITTSTGAQRGFLN